MKANLAQLIEQSKGKFFSITFVKNDGTERTINGKDQYQRLLKGGDSTVENAGFTSFVNRNKEQWASAKSERVKEFKCGSVRVTDFA